MPVPNATITAGGSKIILSNPEDSDNNAVVPSGLVTFTFNDPGSETLGVLAPQDTQNENCLFTSPPGGPLGVATINITGPQVANPTTAQVTVTVIAGQLDHFAPTFEDPPSS